VLFDAEYKSDSSDDQSCSDEDVLEKIVSKPLFEEEIIPMKLDQHPDNAKSDLMESLRTHDSSLLISKKENLLQQEQWAYLITHPSKRLTSFCYDDDDDDDDEDYTSAITPDEPVLSTEEPDNSLSMGDEHLDTILAMKSDEFIKFSVENLIPTESVDQIKDFFKSNEEVSSTDDDSFSLDNIDYVEASPPDSELVSSEVMEIVIPEVGGIDDDIRLTIKDDILRETLLNVKIKALNDNPTPFYDPIASGTPSTLTSSGESDFFLEEVDAFLAVEDEPTL
nr:hypothetical protein [Tanacetum cinerariifolium]